MSHSHILWHVQNAATLSKYHRIFLAVWGWREKCTLSSSFHPLPPSILPFPQSLWNVPVVYCDRLSRYCRHHETIFEGFCFTHCCPSPPPRTLLNLNAAALVSVQFQTLVHITQMWAKCHCGVGKFYRLNWNALSRHKWGGKKNRIKRPDCEVWTLTTVLTIFPFLVCHRLNITCITTVVFVFPETGQGSVPVFQSVWAP